jgi:hypothetical protein
MKRALIAAAVALFTAVAHAYTVPVGYFAVLQFRNSFFMLSQAPCADAEYAARGWRKALHEVPSTVGAIPSCWFHDKKADSINVCWVEPETGKVGDVCEWHPRRAYIDVRALPTEAEVN